MLSYKTPASLKREIDEAARLVANRVKPDNVKSTQVVKTEELARRLAQRNKG